MKKNFYNIDEISQIVGEKKHTIRFWENRIEKLNIIRTHSGHRLYNYENLLLIKKIKVITLGKKNLLSNKKRLFSKLQDKKSVTKVFNELSKRYSSRKGGYSRVLKAGFRTGDDAPMAVIELVDRDTKAKLVDKPKKIEKEEKKTEQKVASK